MKRKNIIFLVVLLVVLIILSVLIVIANTKPKNNLNENKEANLDENILDGSKENDSLENKENLDNNQTKEPVDNTESSENTGDEEQSGNDSTNSQENNTESIQESNPSNFTPSTPPSNSNQENNQSNVNENPTVSSSNQENNSETPVQPVKPQEPVQYNIDNDVPFYSYERVDAKTLDACLTKGNTIVKEKENTDCKQGCRIECEEVAGLHTHQTIGYMLTIYKQKGIEVDF